MPSRPGKRDSRSPWTSPAATRATAPTPAPPFCSRGGRSTSPSWSAHPQASPKPSRRRWDRSRRSRSARARAPPRSDPQWRSIPGSRGSTRVAPRSAWTTSRCRSGRRSQAPPSRRTSSGHSRRASRRGGHEQDAAPDRGRRGVRPGERQGGGGGRRDPRRVHRGRSHRGRAAARCGQARRPWHGGHGGWRGHPFAHRGVERQPRPTPAPGGARGGPGTRASARGSRRDTPLGHRRHDPDDVHDGIPLRGARLHDRDGSRSRPARRAPGARRARRHADHRCRPVHAARQRRLPVAPDRGGRGRPRPGLRGVGALRRGRIRDQDRQPGRVERWKAGGRNVTGLDDAVGSGAVTPRRILETLADAANALELPHPVHIHCNNLGQAGNATTTLETMRALAGRRAHFTHVQFHSYGGERGKSWKSAAKEVIEYVNAHAEVSVDVGQVMFGPVTTLTADAPVGYLLHASSGRKWVNVDVELETGCGIVPYAYREKAAVAALQWAVGLELFLLATDPWRVVLSTDHPNGGSFLTYPELIRLLMDRAYRDAQIKRVNAKLLKGSALADG